MENENEKEYQYSSMKYMDDEELAGAVACLADENRKFLYQRSSEKRELYWEGKSDLSFQLHWEAQTEADFLDGVCQSVEQVKQFEPNTDRIFIEFIPEEFLEGMTTLGFRIVSEWVDFWLLDLAGVVQQEEEFVKIRQLRQEEINQAATITRSCAGCSRGFTGESDEMMKEWMEDKHSAILGAEWDGKLVGICMIKLYGFDSEKGTVIWVREVAVVPELQKRGVGKALLLKAIQWGVQNGAKRSFLAVDAENHSAIGLYRTLGYARKEERGQINMELILEY